MNTKTTARAKTRTAQNNRPAQTPAGELRAENARLAAENRRLDGTVQILAEQMSTVSEHLFPIAGHPAGDVRRILARRRSETTQWGVIDDTLGSPRFWAADHRWYWLTGAPSDAVYPYTEQEARRLGRLLAGQPALPGDELDHGYVAAHLVCLEVQAAEDALAAAVRPEPVQAPAPVEQVEVITLQDHAAHEAVAEPAPAAAHSVPVAEDDSITVIAPVDEPDYQAEPEDRPDAEELLSIKAQGIPANTENDTVALPQARQHGPDETTVMAVPDIAPPPPVALPPMPDVPPVVGPFPSIAWGVPKRTDPLAGPDLKAHVSATEFTRHQVIHIRLP